jgi:hypothetical protein
MNASLFKMFRLHERARLQLEAEFIDLFNTPQWGAPEMNPASSLFGRVTSMQEGTQRRAVLGARLSW